MADTPWGTARYAVALFCGIDPREVFELRFCAPAFARLCHLKRDSF